MSYPTPNAFASTSHASLVSSVGTSYRQSAAGPGVGIHSNGRNGASRDRQIDGSNASNGTKRGKYSISSVLQDPNNPTNASILPSFSLASNSYLPSSLSGLGTTFTSSALPPSSTSSLSSSSGSTGRPVAQRRSQAPLVVISESRKVSKTEFTSYLEQVGKEWERWEKERKLGRRGRADLGVGGVRVENGRGGRRKSSNGAGTIGLGIGGDEREGQSEMEQEDEEDEEYYRSRRHNKEELPPLDGVPQIFFEPDFNLANPRTFDLVTERLQLTPSHSPATPQNEFSPSPNGQFLSDTSPGLGPVTLADLASDQILQEKLSHYTAIVESHLVKEIGLRSSDFFAALSNLQSLHSQGEECLAKILELQSALSGSGEGGIGGGAKRGLEILRKQARRRGLEKIEEGVRSVEEIWTALEGVRELVEQGDWLSALEVSEEVGERYYGVSLESHSAKEGPAEASDGKNGKLGDLLEVEEEGDSTIDFTSPSQSTLNDTSSIDPASSSRPRRPTTRLNLTKVKALDSVPYKLSILRAQIAKSLEGELISILDHEMKLGIEEYVRLNENGEWKGKGKEISASGMTLRLPINGNKGAELVSSAPDEEGIEGEDTGESLARERVAERARSVVRNLTRAKGMEGAIAGWRESVLRDVRSLVREHLPTSETPTAEDEDAFAQTSGRGSIDLGNVSEKSVSLAKKLRAMSHPSFLLLAESTYASLLGCIEIVGLHAQVLSQVSTEMQQDDRLRLAQRRDPDATVESIASASPLVKNSLPAALRESTPRPSMDSTSSGEDSSLLSDITDVVHATAELANLRFSKVIGVRSEIHATLSLEEFVAIFDASWDFVLRCEVICQRMIVGLRGVMVGQAKAFLQAYHQKRLSESAKLVENEQWGAASVSSQTQKTVNLILQSAVSDPSEFLLGKRKRVGGSGISDEGADTKQLDIEGREYFAVSAGLISVEILADYLKVVMNCPLLTTDAMSRVVEYMKSFNSRTCQVVLGAGAMRSAGLKNITAKHLALASQALSIMISLIPYIRETLRRHLNPKQAVMLTEFDKLKRDYQEHQNEIHSKLVAIMGDRLQIHSKSLEAIDWEKAVPGRQEGQPNVYMEALVKEHMTLHKVLSRFLQGPTVEFIMMQVFSALNAGLAEQFSSFEVKTEAAKQRMKVDVVYLKDKLAELKGMERGTPGTELENLISLKQLSEVARPPPSRRLSSLPSVFATSPTASPVSSPTATPTKLPLPLPEVLPSSPVEALPALPPPPALPVPTIEIVPPAPRPVVVPRKSMAERLAEIARRGSGDLQSATAISRTPSPVLAPIEEKKDVLPSIPLEPENISEPDTAIQGKESAPDVKEAEATTLDVEDGAEVVVTDVEHLSQEPAVDEQTEISTLGSSEVLESEAGTTEGDGVDIPLDEEEGAFV